MAGSLRFVFGPTIFLGAFLLFLVEPMAAKALLPALGGSSAVWITCLVFFQTMLLVGYLYAHALAKGIKQLRQLHWAALAIGTLTLFTFVDATLVPNPAHPVATIFRVLGLELGLPFLLLASTSPLLQVWLARTEGVAVRYRLFALSNVGSLLGLFAYPLLIEPHLSLRTQRLAWAVAFAIYACLALLLSSQSSVWKRASPASLTLDPFIGHPGLPQPLSASFAKARLLWFLLPLAAAMQLAAITAHLTVNIAAIPLLWMLPLAAYLLSFIVAFEAPSAVPRGILVRVLAVLMAALGYALTKTDMSLPISVSLVFFLLELFAACLFLHAEVFRRRPHLPAQTTHFYLLVAAGGAAGTFLIGILSPLVFSANYDLALSFLATAAAAVLVTWHDGWGQRLLWSVGSLLLAGLLVGLHIAYSRRILEVDRNFYGTLRVTESNTSAGPTRMLTNGTIQHGTQILRQPDHERTPTTYYAEDSGAGLALLHCCPGRPKRVGVVGLGVGTLAAYARPGDTFRFYEINPLVLPIAQRWFTYLRDAPATLTFAPGDGRASLHAEPPQAFDILVVDAFSGDAIPLHLLTIEAMHEYRRHLAPAGILAFHVSNQYLNLTPEIAALASAVHMQARVFDTRSDPSRGEFRATWVLLSAEPALFDQPGLDRGTPIAPLPNVAAWTDNYSSLLPLVQWSRP